MQRRAGSLGLIFLSVDAMDTMEIRVPGAPRADEIVLAVAFATGRPNARIRGASQETVLDLVRKLQ